MLENRNQAIVSGLLAVSITGFIGATALQFNDRIEYRIGNRIESNPAWLVPAKAEFKGLERGYGGIKITLALLATGASIAMMLLARKEGELEPMRQRIKAYKKKAQEFNHAAESAYQMAGTQMKYKKLLEADEVAFEGEIETAYCESLGIDPRQQQAQLTGTTTLDSVANPSDKVEASTAAVIEPKSTPNKYAYIKGFLSSTCLSWGNQGGGKSWIVRYFVREKLILGYRVIVFDPNSNQASWEGVELYNSYAEIERMMRWYINEVMERYTEFCASNFTEEDWRKQLWAQGQAISIICEEATTYADFIDDEKLLVKFVKVANTLSRKQEMPVTFVTHNNTQTCFGNIKGLGNVIARMQQIELIPTTDPETSQPVASGKAKIKIDGSDKWDEVEVPKIEKKITDFRGFRQSDKQPISTSQESPEQSGNVPIEKPETSGSPGGSVPAHLFGRFSATGTHTASAISSISNCPKLRQRKNHFIAVGSATRGKESRNVHGSAGDARSTNQRGEE
jgi:hypothetical protein